MMRAMTATAPSATPAVRTVEIDPERAGQRVDNYLMSELKGVPRTWVYRVLRKGEVRVNGRRIKPDYRLAAGDRLRIPPVRVRAEGPAARPAAWLEDRILYEDRDLLVLDKPSGMAVHGGSGVSQGVIEALRATRKDARFLELVHRLDRETSGCLMVAKRRSALRRLHELLRRGGVEKRYLALVAGDWREPRWIDAPLRKNSLRGGERLVRVSADGKPARSRFEPLTAFGEATLVEVVLDTGRTHQIRVHAAHAGHPLAGDPRYGDEAFNRRLRELGLRRLFLHAHRLAFSPGEDRPPVDVSAPLPEDLAAVVDRLTQAGES